MHKEIGRNRIKRVRILAPLVMVLLVAQLMVPGVTVAQVQMVEHRITFVLGTDENLASLVNASVNATVNISIYNETEAKSVNFSNESVVFLASLENETVASINQTINRSAYVVAYNLSSSISIGNVDDVNITKYWVWGGDENIRNLITYMDNRFYGNSTAVDPPEPPEGRAKVAFVVSEVSSYAAWLENTLDDVYITRNLNVSLCTYT
ncbi:MAG: hypothetical protein ACXQT5_06660, partial [Candidatus Syntropharchaeia archaeon]